MSSKVYTYQDGKVASKQQSSKPTDRDTAAITEDVHPAAIVQRARYNPRSLTQSDVLQLQRTIGNRAVQRLLHTTANHQTKLPVNTSADIYEQEADRVADHVMPMPEPAIQRQHEVREERAEEAAVIQTKQTANQGAFPAQKTESSEVPPIVGEVVNSPGQPLDSSASDLMETRFGHDFGQVRVHTDDKAAESAHAVNASAYTLGQDVVFGAGQYAPGTTKGYRLLAHELTHVVQQGFTSQAIQRKPDQKPKPPTTKPKPPTATPQSVYDEIKKRNPDLAELITPGSINRSSPKEPPAIKGGPMQNGEEHIWKVTVLSAQGFAGSQISGGRESRKKVKGGVQVTHFLDITWALPIGQPDPEYVKQTSSADEAFTLTAAAPLYHELLHARLMMERDPHWTSQHTQVFQDFTNIMQIANSPTVDRERQALKQEIGQMAAGGDQVKDVAVAQDMYYEFLVHEKYDADTAGKAFGKSYPNALIAKKYSEVVALRLGLGDRTFRVLKDKLAAAAEKLFDKLDQAAKPSTPNTPTSSPPATKQPEK